MYAASAAYPYYCRLHVHEVQIYLLLMSTARVFCRECGRIIAGDRTPNVVIRYWHSPVMPEIQSDILC